MPESPSDSHETSTVAQPRQPTSGPVSGYGVASAVLAVVALAATALIAVLWNGHRSTQEDRNYQARVMQAAAQWTGILININVGNVESSMAQLRDGTVGELNAGFDKSIAPYRDVVKTLQANTTGQVESVSIEVVHHDLDNQPGQRPPAPATLPADLAARTDTVLVVATSVSENAGNRTAATAPGEPAAPAGPSGPTTVRWNLRLGVAEVDGAPKITRLESLR